jgi:pyruvate,water dikinase
VNGYAYCRASYHFSWRLLWKLPGVLYAYITVVPKLLKNIKRHWQEEALPKYLRAIEKWQRIDVKTTSDAQLFAGVQELAIADANYWFQVSMMIASAKVTDGLLDRYLQCWFIPGNLTSGMFLRGFDSRTMAAQIDLEAIAKRILQDSSLCKLVQATPADRLLQTLHQNPHGGQVAAAIRDYLKTNGHQVYNLDFVEPTLGEEPSAVLFALQGLVESRQFDAEARKAELVQKRDSLTAQTMSSLGPTRRWLFRTFLRWAQSFGPYREEALFYMGAAWATLRQLALELGRRLVTSKSLTVPDDIFYLTSAELSEAQSARACGQPPADLRRIATERRQLRAARKKLHPPGMIPEGSHWKFGPFDMTAWETQKRNPADADTLVGFAVSPGTVTGTATVISSPEQFDLMRADTILVCPTTTPAWTPLFAQARGLVTDMGGVLAHGSIVAREYGIPAVLGTGNGTQRIVTGQRITVDGDVGTVTIEQPS